jgi:hypothetical protein
MVKMEMTDNFDIRDNKELDKVFYEYCDKFEEYDLKIYSFGSDLTNDQLIKLLKEAIKTGKKIEG